MRKNLWKMCVVQFVWEQGSPLCPIQLFLDAKEISPNSILKQGFLLLVLLELTGQIF